jgi:hypothetical protein
MCVWKYIFVRYQTDEYTFTQTLDQEFSGLTQSLIGIVSFQKPVHQKNFCKKHVRSIRCLSRKRHVTIFIKLL